MPKQENRLDALANRPPGPLANIKPKVQSPLPESEARNGDSASQSRPAQQSPLPEREVREGDSQSHLRPVQQFQSVVEEDLPKGGRPTKLDDEKATEKVTAYFTPEQYDKIEELQRAYRKLSKGKKRISVNELLRRLVEHSDIQDLL